MEIFFHLKRRNIDKSETEVVRISLAIMDYGSGYLNHLSGKGTL